MDYRHLKLLKKYLSKNFLNKDSFIPRNAVACILTLNNEYVVQLRDDKPNIFFPSFWSLFGGEIEKNENAEDALIREIYEEINLRIKKKLKYFTSLKFDYAFCGMKEYYRKYYTYEINESAYSKLKLNEGQSFDKFDALTLLNKNNFVPYDSFVIWMHYKNNQKNGKNLF